MKTIFNAIKLKSKKCTNSKGAITTKTKFKTIVLTAYGTATSENITSSVITTSTNGERRMYSHTMWKSSDM